MSMSHQEKKLPRKGHFFILEGSDQARSCPCQHRGMDPEDKTQAGLGRTFWEALGLVKLNHVLFLISAKHSPAAGKGLKFLVTQ